MTWTPVLRPGGRGRFVLLCDHASNHIPAELGNLGLAKSELGRHIAWDIGAAGVTRALSELLDSPAILSGASRLVIDCNRKLTSSELIPAVIHGMAVPGNASICSASRRARIDQWYRPYHDAVETVLINNLGRGVDSVVVAVHSMAPVLFGRERPWQIAISSHMDRCLAEPVLAALRASGDFLVGDNEPYCIDPLIDYSIPFHALKRGLPNLQIEFRQDEIATAAEQRRWAKITADILIACASA